MIFKKSRLIEIFLLLALFCLCNLQCYTVLLFISDQSNSVPDTNNPADDDSRPGEYIPQQQEGEPPGRPGEHIRPRGEIPGHNPEQRIDPSQVPPTDTPVEAPNEAPAPDDPGNPNTPNSPDTNLNQGGVNGVDSQQHQTNLQQGDTVDASLSDQVAGGGGGGGGGDKNPGDGDSGSPPEDTGGSEPIVDQPVVNQEPDNSQEPEVNKMSSHINDVNVEVSLEGSHTDDIQSEQQVDATPPYEVIDGTTIYLDDLEDIAPFDGGASIPGQIEPTPVPGSAQHAEVNLEPTPHSDGMPSDQQQQVHATPSLPNDQEKSASDHQPPDKWYSTETIQNPIRSRS